jgi:hypothetical protein
MKINDYVRFFEKLNDPEFPSSGHSVRDSDVCVALIGCLECTALNGISTLSDVRCCRNTGLCPRVFDVCKSVRDSLMVD